MDDNATLKKMIDIIDKIQSYIIGLDYNAFVQNDMIVEACAFNFGQLGELSHRLTDEFQSDTPNIPWKAIYGMRNKIIHDYDGVNLKVIWETITEDLPELRNQLKNVLIGG